MRNASGARTAWPVLLLPHSRMLTVNGAPGLAIASSNLTQKGSTPHLQAQLFPSAKKPVHGRQHSPPALCPEHPHLTVHGQKADQGQAILHLHRGPRRQVPAHLLCQGKGASGCVGQRSKYRRFTEHNERFQPVRKKSLLSGLVCYALLPPLDFLNFFHFGA